ncbi:MAG: DUF1848 domain-containing protein [Lachnospiraceae bacterium]|nr:DUF1848 domain-containing protein [Lachnospiraceae bacterium]
MIINTGMRTDIPAFYAEWFIKRIREGYVYTRNPYNNTQVTKYRLTPEVVDVLAFCTKNPAPMLPYMEELKKYGQYWFVTITPYGADLEPNVPPKEQVMEDFLKLSRIVGADSMGWRYDPIIITDKYTVERHISDFSMMAEKLAGYTHTCVISFIDLYKKVRRNFSEAKEVAHADKMALGKEFIRICKKYDMVVKPCAEGDELARYGADCSGCMTKHTFEKAIHCRLDVPNIKSQRSECACLLGKDIGQYDTCGHLCRYCYANVNSDAVRRNMKLHNPQSPFLVGELREDDVIHEVNQSSWRNEQINLFDAVEFQIWNG